MTPFDLPRYALTATDVVQSVDRLVKRGAPILHVPLQHQRVPFLKERLHDYFVENNLCGKDLEWREELDGDDSWLCLRDRAHEGDCGVTPKVHISVREIHKGVLGPRVERGVEI